jgi:hypothetical protein
MKKTVLILVCSMLITSISFAQSQDKTAAAKTKEENKKEFKSDKYKVKKKKADKAKPAETK